MEKIKQLASKVRISRAVLIALLSVGLIPVLYTSVSFAQAGIPIIDNVLSFIDDYKMGIAMIGIAVVGVGLLIKPIMPSLWDKNKEAIIYMIIGGIVLTMIPTIAGLVIGG